MVDYQKAFNEFDAAGGRQALERQLAEIDRVAQASVLEGVEPDSRLMALREGLQRLLAAINDLVAASTTSDSAAGVGPSTPKLDAGDEERAEDT